MEVLTFDDNVTLKDFGMKCVGQLTQPFTGSISSRNEQISNRKGLLDFGNEIGAIIEKYEIAVFAKSPVERSYQIRRFKQFLLDEYGYPRFIKVHNDFEPDVYFWAKMTTAPIPTLYTNSGTFTLEVINSDGIKYSVAEADEILWGSTIIDFRSNYTLGHVGSGAINKQINNNTTFTPTILGTAVHPFFILQGSGSNVKITCDGKTIEIGNFSGKLEIDTAERIAYLNGNEKIIRMDKFLLVKNKPVSVTGSNMNFTLSNYYRDEL